MSTMYSRIENLCKDNFMDVTGLCRELGIPRSSLSELKSGRAKSISADKVSKIADFFHVTASYITNGIAEKFLKNVVIKYEEENIKAEARALVSLYPNNCLQDAVDAQIKVFECLFTRSLRASGYNINHVTFEEYVSYMLGQTTIKNSLHNDIYHELEKIYGIKPGMTEGSSIIDVKNTGSKFIDFPVVTDEDIKFALFGGEEGITNEMLDEVKEFAKFVKNKYKKD